MADLEQSITAWLNINELSRQADSIEELTDGVLLFELMSNADMFDIDSIYPNPGSNWAYRLANLRKLIRCLKNFYIKEIGVHLEQIIDDSELNILTQSENTLDMMPIMQIILGAVLQCSQRESYISRIMTLLDNVHQDNIMIFVSAVIEKCQKIENSPTVSDNTKKQLQQLKADKLKLNKKIEEFQHELESSQELYQTAASERDSLRSQVIDLESQLERIKTRKIQAAADQLSTELEFQIQSKDKTINDLRQQLMDIKRAHETEIIQLRDDLDMSHERNLQMQKAESQLEMYRKRLEEMGALQKRVKDLEEDKIQLEDKLSQAEVGSSDTQSLKQTLNYYKEQLTSEKERNVALSMEIDDKDRQLKEFQRVKKELEDFKKYAEAQIKELQSEIERAHQEGSENSFSFDRGLHSELEDQLKRLERENKALKDSRGHEAIVDELNSQLDESLKARRVAEENMGKVQKELHQTKERLAQVTKEHETYSQLAQDFEEQVNNLTQEKENLEAQVRVLIEIKGKYEIAVQTLEEMKLERETNLGEMRKLYSEKDEISSRYFEVKEELHKKDTIIAQQEGTIKAAELDRERMENKLKEAQESERIALSEMEVWKNRQGQSQDQGDKIQLLEFERDVMKLRSEVSSLKLSLREKDDALSSLEAEKAKQCDELQQQFTEQEMRIKEQHATDLQQLRIALKEKEQEAEEMLQSKQEQGDLCDWELRKMSMIVHEIGMFYMSQQKESDKSWIAKQRD